MPRFYKGRTNNHLTFVMVNATNFATPESALSAAIKLKIWGKLRTAAGVNFVTSGTGSLTNDIIHVGPSVLGQYTIALAKADLSDASAAWYDEYICNMSATGAAYQTVIAEGVIDDSNLSGVVSDIYSALLLAQSMASDAASAAQQANSRVILVQSRLSDFDSRLVSDVSDIRSMLSDMMSDFQSRVPKAVATNSQLSDLHSDLRSLIALGLNASDMSDLRSAIAAGPAGVLTVSDISDIASRVWADTIGARVDSRLLVTKSQASDTWSMLSDLLSDFQSRVPKRVATDSQLSDMASDLKSAITIVQSMASDAASAAAQANSRVLVVQSMVSDTQSALSDFRSDLHSFVSTTGIQLNASSISDLRSAIAAITATLSASDLSDIRSAITAAQSDLRSLISSAGPTISDMASAIWNEKYQRNSAASTFGSLFSVIGTNAAAGASRALLNQSRISDAQSYLVALSGLISDIQSAVAAGGTVTVSNISDIASAVDAILASRLSDILSAAVQANSRVLLNKSVISDVQSMLSDFLSDFQSRVPKRVATDSQLSDLASDIKSVALLNQSFLSDIDSALTSRFSDLHSFVSTTGVQVNASSLSDIRSAITAITLTLSASDISDIASAVLAGAGTTTISASDMSDIASRVWAMATAVALSSRVLAITSTASDAASAAQQANSRTLVAQSFLSDIDSALTSRFSDLHSFVSTTGVQVNASSLSDLRSAITAGGAAAITTSDISDIASAVWANLIGARVDSRVLVNKSVISDVQSAVAALPAVASDLSDILSSARKVNSQLLLAQSVLSDVQSAVAVLPGAKLAAQADAVCTAVIGNGSTTTTVKISTVDGGVPSAVNDFYKGRVIIFTSGALKQQATSISSYDGASTTATVVLLTGAPVNAVTAVIV